jgi:hypothetical protein
VAAIDLNWAQSARQRDILNEFSPISAGKRIVYDAK